MIIKMHRDLVDDAGGIIDPIAKVTAPVIHGNLNRLNRSGYTIVISNVLHALFLLLGSNKVFCCSSDLPF